MVVGWGDLSEGKRYFRATEGAKDVNEDISRPQLHDRANEDRDDSRRSWLEAPDRTPGRFRQTAQWLALAGESDVSALVKCVGGKERGRKRRKSQKSREKQRKRGMRREGRTCSSWDDDKRGDNHEGPIRSGSFPGDLLLTVTLTAKGLTGTPVKEVGRVFFPLFPVHAGLCRTLYVFRFALSSSSTGFCH